MLRDRVPFFRLDPGAERPRHIRSATNRRRSINRTLIAAAFAAAPAGPLVRSYPLRCKLNAADGAALKVRIRVTNTTAHRIAEGSKIQLTVVFRGRRTTTMQMAYKSVAPNDSIGFDQPNGALFCRASIVVDRITSTKIEKFPR